MENELDGFNAEEATTPEVKPASAISWDTNATAVVTYTKECIVCDTPFANTKNEAGLCSKCKEEMNLLIRNR